jgi:hypothetical protein
MVKISKEDALVYRNSVMNMVQEYGVHQRRGAPMSLSELNEVADELQGIDDYLCRALGLDPETVENWYD